MRHSKVIWASIAASLGAISCGAGPGEAELRQVLESNRAAHLSVDASMLVAHLADSVISVDAGAVFVQTREEIEDSYRAYFEGATYRAWEDIDPPVIAIATDGSLASVTRRVRVDREGPRFGGRLARVQFVAAWTATYEPDGDTWKMTSVTSTSASDPSTAQVLAGVRRALDPGGSIGNVEFVRFEAEASGPGGPDYQVSVRSTVAGNVRLDFSMGFSAAMTPDHGWVRLDPAAPPETMTDTLESFVRGHDLILNVLNPDRRFGPLRFAGEQTFGEVPAIRIDGADALGSPIEFYYAKSDTIPLGFRLVDHLRGRGPVITSLFDWALRDGLRLPTRARFVQGEEVFHYEITLVETAATTDDRVFDPDA